MTRIPVSVSYAAGFALLIIIAAVYNNYETLSIRLRLFNTPAFQKLNGKWLKEGLGSISKELSITKLVIYKEFVYRFEIIIDEDNLTKFYLRITPTCGLHGKARKECETALKRDLMIDRSISALAVKLSIPEEKLDDPRYLIRYLSLIHAQVLTCLLAQETIS